MAILLACVGYLFNSLVSVFDKIVINKAIPQALVYTAVLNILGLLTLFLVPFGFEMLQGKLLYLALFTGCLYTFGLLTFFTALKDSDASVVVTIVGAVQPLVIFFIAQKFLHEQLSWSQMLALFLLILGGILLSWNKMQDKKKMALIFISICSGLFFGLYYSFNKYLFLQTNFINGLIWPRLGAFFIMAPFLLRKTFWKNLRSLKTVKPRFGYFFIFGQVSGSLGMFILHYAIYLGSVTIINALQGLQYLFVFIFTLAISKFKPWLIKETLERRVVFGKFLGIFLIIVGVFLLQF